MVPQSNIYRRGLFGGGALCGCAIASGAATARRANREATAFFIRWQAYRERAPEDKALGADLESIEESQLCALILLDARFWRRCYRTITGASRHARSAFAAEAPFHCGGIDHLALAVDDLERSVHFYARVFGATVLKEKTNPRHYIKLGPNYVAMAPPGQGQAAPSINHFCPGIVNFDLAATKNKLDQMGIKYREAPPVGLFVPDPDGTLVQLWTENSWSRLGETAAPDAMRDAPPMHGEPLLRPTAIDHILVNVSDVPKSVAFYQKILGGVIRVGGTPERTWFSAGGKDRVGLGLAEPGHKLASTTIASPLSSTAPRSPKAWNRPAQRSFRAMSPRASIFWTSTGFTCRFFRPRAPDGLL